MKGCPIPDGLFFIKNRFGVITFWLFSILMVISSREKKLTGKGNHGFALFLISENTTGYVQKNSHHTYDYFTKVIDQDGRVFTVYTDSESLQEEMMAIAPEDRKQIRRIVRDIKVLMRNEMPPGFTLKDLIPTVCSILMIYKYRQPIRVLAERFINPVLKDFFIKGLDWGEMCSAFLLWTLALMGSKKAGYPIGGSLNFIQSIIDR